MGKTAIRVRTSAAALLSGLCLTMLSAKAATVTVDCDAGNAIAGALNGLKPGDSLLVSGTCKEQVSIAVQVVNITLDGQRKATIQHPGSSGASPHAVFVRGREITIKGFTVTGGQDGIHLSGPASAVIDGNIVANSARHGIHIDKGSVARIINNMIQNSGRVGIDVSGNSNAYIGFLFPQNPTLAPNTVQNNGGHGINVERVSGAWIVGNTISNNKGSGIAVSRSSHADIIANAINENGGDAITVSHNAGVHFSSESRREGPNQTGATQENSGTGINCVIGGYVEGPLGTLMGARGAKEFDNTCIDRVVAP